MIFSLSGAKKAIFITGMTWLLITVLIHFIVPGILQYILLLTSCILFILLPVVNHIRMYLSIRSHNNQVSGAVHEQLLPQILRREKKAASDMFIVGLILFACLGPMLVIKLVFQSSFLKLYDLLYPWAFTLLYLNSSINPVIYLMRNKELRSALKAVTPFCC